MEIRLSSRKVALKFAIGAAILVLIHLTLQTLKFAFGHDEAFGLTKMFDLGLEYNIPTVYSFLLFITAARLLGFIAYDALTKHKRFAHVWVGLSIIFFWLGLDEMLVIHEKWIVPLRDFFHTTGFLHYLWQVPYLILFIILCAFCVPFWKNLPKSTRSLFLISAFVYLIAPMILEPVEGWYISILKEKYTRSLPLMIISTFEETLEMGGLVIFIYALLEYARSEIRQVVLHWQPAKT